MQTLRIDIILNAAQAAEDDGTMTTVNWKQERLNVIMEFVMQSQLAD